MTSLTRANVIGSFGLIISKYNERRFFLIAGALFDIYLDFKYRIQLCGVRHVTYLEIQISDCEAFCLIFEIFCFETNFRIADMPRHSAKNSAHCIVFLHKNLSLSFLHFHKKIIFILRNCCGN